MFSFSWKSYKSTVCMCIIRASFKISECLCSYVNCKISWWICMEFIIWRFHETSWQTYTKLNMYWCICLCVSVCVCICPHRWTWERHWLLLKNRISAICQCVYVNFIWKTGTRCASVYEIEHYIVIVFNKLFDGPWKKERERTD